MAKIAEMKPGNPKERSVQYTEQVGVKPDSTKPRSGFFAWCCWAVNLSTIFAVEVEEMKYMVVFDTAAARTVSGTWWLRIPRIPLGKMRSTNQQGPRA